MKSKNYTMRLWADGFGIWHAKAVFSPPLGNTGESERVFENARKTAWRQIRNEILIRQPRGVTVRDLAPIKLKVTDNTLEPGLGRLRAIEWKER